MKKIVFSTIIVLFFATMAAQAYVQIGDGELSTSIPLTMFGIMPGAVKFIARKPWVKQRTLLV